MPKIFYCSKSQDEHERPVGKKCQLKLADESFSSASEVIAPPPPSTSGSDFKYIATDSEENRVDGQEGAAYCGCTRTG